MLGDAADMIDIHTHLLPGIDDGAGNWTDTLELARAAVADGITAVVATPHHENGVYRNEAADVLRLAREAQERLASEGIPLTVLAGQEIRVHDRLLDAWSAGTLLPLAGTRYVLLEFSSGAMPRDIGELLHEFSILGLTAVIAHPERNAEIARHPERLAALAQAGALAQVTTHSLLGGFGSRVEKLSWELMRQGLVQLVSSDAHHVDRRGFRLAEAYRRIGQTLGEDGETVLRRNAEKLIRGEEIAVGPPGKSTSNFYKKVAKYFRLG